MSSEHSFQQVICTDRVGLGPILNAACKEDPARLGELFDAVNLDICDYDPHTKTDLKKLPNFVHGSVFDLRSYFGIGQFKTVILGEFLEHAVYGAALNAMIECWHVLADDGILVITFPLDGRPAEVQHAKELLITWVEGETGHDVTTHHQHVWEDDELEKLFEESGFTELSRTELGYGFVHDRTPSGWGILLEKAQE